MRFATNFGRARRPRLPRVAGFLQTSPEALLGGRVQSVESAQLRAKSRLCGPGPLHPVSPRCPDIRMRMEAVERGTVRCSPQLEATRPTQAHRPKPVVPVKEAPRKLPALGISPLKFHR